MQILEKSKREKLQSITADDLEDAHRVALRIISKCKSEDVGIISFYESIFPEILKSCVNEEGKLDPPILLYYRGNLDVLKSLELLSLEPESLLEMAFWQENIFLVNLPNEGITSSQALPSDAILLGIRVH